ncbi:MAG: 16S rRNA (cytosine(967)-C(5))-methyltransferase RsmB [Oscillospiraceae bacterium]
MKTSRQCALEALSKVSGSGSYSNITIDKILEKYKLDNRDSRLVTALFYGTLERKITLDYCINAFSKKPTEKMTPMVLDILRMSFYQILYMDTIPTSAAVNEGVNLTKTVGLTSASSFVNGILRSFLRAGGEIPPIKGEPAEVLSIEYSCEKWLCQKLIEEYGEEETRNILDVSTGAPPVFIRVNTTKTTQEKLMESFAEKQIIFETTQVPNCLMITNGGDLIKTDEFEKGLFHVQDMSSQICSQTLNPQKGDEIADVCSAPGGKTFTIAQLIEDTGRVLAMDLHQSRTKLIISGAKRLGLKSVEAMAQDATVFNENLGTFDKVLCDVPCSGFGIIRRKPEIKYKSYEEIKKLPDIQYKILENSSKYLKIGGTLVYSTCTMLKEENEMVVEKFLSNNPNFEPFEKDNYTKTFIPDKKGTDGFFISKIRRVK